MDVRYNASRPIPRPAGGEAAAPAGDRAEGSASSASRVRVRRAGRERFALDPMAPSVWSSLPDPLVSRLPTASLLAARLVSRTWRADVDRSAASLYGLALPHDARAPRSWPKALVEKIAFARAFSPLVSSAAPPAVRARLRAEASEASLVRAESSIRHWRFDAAILALQQVDLSVKGVEAKALYERALLHRPIEREIIARSPDAELPEVLHTLAEISRRGPEPLLDLAERRGVSLSESRKYPHWQLPRTAFDQAMIADDAPLALALFDRIGDQDINQVFGGLTPLQRAARTGNAALARGLLERAADLTVTTGRGRTALDEAVAREHHSTALVILDGYRARSTVPQNLELLLTAVGAHRPLALGLLALDREFGERQGGRALGRLLLDWIERDRAEPTQEPVSPKLFDAASPGVQLRFARQLAASWKEVSEIVSLIPALATFQLDGATLLHHLVAYDPGLHGLPPRIVPETMRALLDAGADPNAKDRAGKTPLLGMDSDPEVAHDMVSLLFERGADLNARGLEMIEDAEGCFARVASGSASRVADFARTALHAIRECRREALSLDAWFPFG